MWLIMRIAVNIKTDYTVLKNLVWREVKTAQQPCVKPYEKTF